MERFFCRAGWAIFPIRLMPDIAATAFIAGIRICCPGSARISPVSAACSMEETCDGIRGWGSCWERRGWNRTPRGKGTALNPADHAAPRIPYSESSRADWMNQYYGEYAVGKARIDSEYRRYVRDQLLFGGNSRNLTDVRGWYVSGSYRVAKRLDFGAYYSHYAIVSIIGGALSQFVPSPTNTSLPANHIYDKVITGRILLRKYWDAKIEGHFMDGFGSSTYPDGFYLQANANGFKPKTNALVVKTSFSF